MTAGEELLLEDVLSRREPLAITDLLSWHQHLPPAQTGECSTSVELIAVVISVPG